MQVSRLLATRRLSHTRFLFSAASSISPIPRTKLPELPPPPLLLPFASVQSITQADIDLYVSPLYERNWRVFIDLPNLILSDDSLERWARNALVLGKKFWFLRGRTAAKFLVDVVELAGQEEHKPKITLFLGRRGQYVLVKMHTSRTLGEAEGLPKPTSVKPGLSAWDLRLALLLENRFQDKYVASGQALPLPEMLLKPYVPDVAELHRWHDSTTARATTLLKADAKWAPRPSARSVLPPPPALEDAETICTDAHFEAFLRPLYLRGWHAAFLPIRGNDKLYAPTLCLTGFFRFTSSAAAIAFIHDVVAFPWYKEDNAELHFLVDAQTVRAQLKYPPEHTALTLGNLRAALRIEQLFDTKYVSFARMSYVHPYRAVHQPGSVEELQQTREKTLRLFYLRQNAKVSWM
ncbi:hypothetical protein FB451DRAFT_1236357 [Mycena latifolia]|nr:hypothetical protein FB451DRAFT_1236357 [Mycena latifolia]